MRETEEKLQVAGTGRPAGRCAENVEKRGEKKELEWPLNNE
jgi:hypothetical protein